MKAVKNCDREFILNDVSKLIAVGNTSGYYPYWKLSFGDYYRSWHLKSENLELVAKAVLLGNLSGVISEIIEDKKVQIYWNIDFECK